MERGEARNTILTVGIDLISLQGYHATGIDQVLKRAGVPKGSFYHYFQSKEEFGLAIIQEFAEQYSRRLEGFLKDSSVPPLKRIRNYMEDAQQWFVDNSHARGCLIGNLGQELADQNDRFRARLGEVFTRWTHLYAECVEEAQQRGELAADLHAPTLGEFILTGWEGALLRAKVAKSHLPLAHFIDVLFQTTLKSL